MQSALDLLDFNSTPEFIVPSAGQYPHLWLWDACFHAIVLAHLRPELAPRELQALFATQFKDGMIPHVRFSAYADPESYRPNASDWGTGGPYSGITQVPMIAPAAKIVFQKTGDRRFLRRAYSHIVRFHNWLKEVRDPEDIGLLSILHPWESGTDNSPIFDELKDRFLRQHLPHGFQPPPRADTRRVPDWQRPSEDYYEFYWGLIHLFRQLDWKPREMMRRSPVRVADVLFNSVWAKANQDLAQLAWVLDKPSDSERFSNWAQHTCRALRRHCWHARDRFFYPLDLVSGRLIRTGTASGFMPLYAGATTPAMADHLLEHLMDRREFYYHLGVPSTSFETPAFDPCRYWRGPVWINIHWLLQRGLLRYGYLDIAAKLTHKSRSLVDKEGYWEYYDPFVGKGLGASYFAWSTLTDIMSPLESPAELRQTILVISPEDARRQPQLRTLYLHPATRTVDLSADGITSGPQIFTKEVLQAVRQRALASLVPMEEGHFERRLRQVAGITQSLVQEKRAQWQDYPRVCDLVSVAGHQVFTRLGYQCVIRSTPNLHYFLRIISPKGKHWIVDLSPSQFSWHPVSRIPLLLERASLDIETALPLCSPPLLALQDLLEETQVAVHRNWVALERERMDRHERKAFLLAGQRHRRIVHELAQRMDLSIAFYRQYLQWLARILKAVRRRY